LATAPLVLEIGAVVIGGGALERLAGAIEVLCKIGQVAAVGVDGVVGEAALGGEVQEEITQLWPGCGRKR
jgi:hypothetical protein